MFFEIVFSETENMDLFSGYDKLNSLKYTFIVMIGYLNAEFNSLLVITHLNAEINSLQF